MLYGGSSISSAAHAELRRCGVPVASQYGQTEVGGMAMIGEPGAPHGLLKPVCGVSCQLLSDSPSGEEGELLLLGMQSATAGYLGRPPPEPPLCVRHATGDLFRRVWADDGAGGGEWWYHHVARRDDLIVHTTGE